MSYMMLGFCIKSRNYKWESWCLSEMGWIPLLWCSPAALFPHKQRNLILLCDSMHFYCIGTTFCPPLCFWALVGCITITVISVVVNIDVEVSLRYLEKQSSECALVKLPSQQRAQRQTSEMWGDGIVCKGNEKTFMTVRREYSSNTKWLSVGHWERRKG